MWMVYDVLDIVELKTSWLTNHNFIKWENIQHANIVEREKGKSLTI